MSKYSFMAPLITLGRVLVLVALGSASDGSIAAPTEWVSLVVPPGWSVGHQEDRITSSITEYVRGKETVQSWTELITLQHFFLGTWGGQDPAEVYTTLQQQQEKLCPGAATWNVISQDPHRVVYEWSTSGVCEGWPRQQEIAAILVGRTDRYRVAYTTTKIPMAASLHDAWVRALECLQVTSKKVSGLPVWGRPSAPPWVQQIMDSKSWTVEGYTLSGLPIAEGAVMSSCDGVLDADRVTFIVESGGGTYVQVQTVERAAGVPFNSVTQFRDPEAKKHKKDCGQNWTSKTYAETTDRIVYEDVFKGCKAVDDLFEVAAEFLAGDHIFVWTTYVRDGSLSDEARAVVVESVSGVRLEQASPAR